MTASRKIVQTTRLLMAGLFLLGGFAGASQAADITEAMIQEKVSAYVQDKLQTLLNGQDGATVQVDIIRVPSAPFAFPKAAKAADVQVTLDSSLGDMYSDRSIVRVRMEDAAGQSREVGVPVRIVIQKPVWVVKNVVSANAALRTSDFKMEMRDVSRTYGHVVGQEKELGQYVARVNLMPGELLDTRKIAIPPDVRCNNEVQILMTNGNGMTVSIPGVALANGRVGDTIRVRQTRFQRKYHMAKVISKNQVQVDI